MKTEHRLAVAAEGAVLAAISRDVFGGVSFPDINDRRTWHIRFNDTATEQEREAAQAALDAFDPVAEAAKPKPKTLEERVAELEARLIVLEGRGR